MIIEVKRNPRLTRKKINKFAKTFGAAISHRTVGRIFNKYGLRGCRPVKAPYHKLSHRKNRVQFAKDYKGKTFSILPLEPTMYRVGQKFPDTWILKHLLG